MAQLKLERTNEYNNRLRDYQVYIDDNKVGTIANGESKMFELCAGQHKLVCKIDWCSSPEIPIEVSDDTLKTYKVGGFKYGSWLLPVFLAFIFVVPLLRRANPELRHLYYLYIPIGALLIYFLTIGRRKYLTLKEV